MSESVLELIKRLGKQFNAADTDNDMMLSKSELQSSFDNIQNEIPDCNLSFDEVWSKCDVNADGEVSFGEFVRALQ
ncbi:hypothetical protein SNEBB_002715 [Seison nebaliae]|nr:hypothetical protein SNEBB_002715 [Seison nebaliae]